MRKLILILVCIGLLSLPLSAMAATEAEKQAAIDKGLAYLASIQSVVDGGMPGSYRLASTAAAVLAWAEEGSTISGGPYQTNVQNALNYVFTRAFSQQIGPQTYIGNPDTNIANGSGVYFDYNSRPTYEVGLAIPAIVKGGAPGAFVTTGSQAGRTYLDVVKDTVDWVAWAQNEAGGNQYRGGWRYSGNYSSSDNSVSQWPVIGLLYASEWGAVPNPLVKNELALWVNYIQNMAAGPNYGASGYTAPGDWNNPSKTGGLLIQKDYLGVALGDPRVQAALGYINNKWQTIGDDGNFQSAYAMWAIYKGLELTIGLDDIAEITNLRNQALLRGGLGAPLDPGDTWNWFEDYCEYLVSTQTDLGGGLGRWTNVGGYSDSYLGTAWYINILAATEIPGPNGIPEPATLILLGSGLAGLAGYARKRMKK